MRPGVSLVRLTAQTGVAMLVIACGGGTEPRDTTPASVVVSPPNTSQALVSGSTLQLSAEVRTRGGSPLPGAAVTWLSSASGVADVSSSGLVTAALGGTATITASAGAGVSSSVSVVVTPGAAARLGVRTQPGGATSGAALIVQPVIEVRDVAGNTVTSASPVVTAVIASGAGTLGGTTTVTGANGIATFIDLTLTGVVGDRTLTFSSPGLASVTSAPVAVAAGAPAQLSVRTQPPGTAAVGAPFGTQPVIDVLDASGNAARSAPGPVTAAIVQGSATLGGTATVAALGGAATFQDLSIVGPVGNYTLRFSAPGLATVTSSQIALTPGVPSRLAMRTQPAGAVLGAAFATQPAVQVQDAGGNVLTTATHAVTAAIVSGGGTLGGTPTATAIGGVATFDNLSIAGLAGERTLSFAAAGLAAVVSAPFMVGGSNAPFLVATPASVTFDGSAGGSAPSPKTVSIANGGVQPLGTLGGTIQYVGGAGGWLAGTLSSLAAPATLTLTVNTFGLSAGTYTANVSLTSVGAANSPLVIPVTLTLAAPWTVAYGTGNRVAIVNAGVTTAPSVVVRDGAGAVVASPPVTFVVRSPALASVSAAGAITGVVSGETWIVATAAGPGSPRDSVLAVVTRDANGPVLRADIPAAVMNSGDLITVPIVLDMRSAGRLSAATATVTWPADFWTGFLSYVSHSVGPSSINPVVSVNGTNGIVRISVASAAGVDGPVELMRITFRANNAGRSGVLVLTANEVVTSDLTPVTDQVTSVYYPLRVR